MLHNQQTNEFSCNSLVKLTRIKNTRGALLTVAAKDGVNSLPIFRTNYQIFKDLRFLYFVNRCVADFGFKFAVIAIFYQIIDVYAGK